MNGVVRDLKLNADSLLISNRIFDALLWPSLAKAAFQDTSSDTFQIFLDNAFVVDKTRNDSAPTLKKNLRASVKSCFILKVHMLVSKYN
jgi:hypothetical protein